MRQYNVNGMTCAACSARVEKAVSKVNGVNTVSVSLLTNSMGVEGTALDIDIIKAVEQAGYEASVKGTGSKSDNKNQLDDEYLQDKETPRLKRRLIVSLCFLLPLMYVSMGHMQIPR